ncbi:Uncharacterised protein [Mycobacteroides abscessus subsp. abscessus]|nr:Uncharacterised protein [Mycobacteroides abscessus subsp. abscessus]
MSANVGASAALSTTGGPSVVSATQPVPRKVVLNRPPVTTLAPLTRSIFQFRPAEKASTFLPLMDRPALFRFSRCTSKARSARNTSPWPEQRMSGRPSPVSAFFRNLAAPPPSKAKSTLP